MKQVIELGGPLNPNPYIVQMEKLSESLKNLSGVFVREGNLAEQKVEQGVDRIQYRIEKTVCSDCENKCECEYTEVAKQQSMIKELVDDLEEYGVELSIIKKRSLQKKCSEFERLKQEVEVALAEQKQWSLWEKKLKQNKEASLVAIHAFADAIEEITRELDASIFRDERLEKKIGQGLKKVGIRPLKITLMVSNQGRYEIQISAKARRGVCITTKEVASILSDIVGMNMIQEQKEPIKLREEYSTMIFIERLRYHTLYGMAKRKKKGSEISGDNFLVMDMPGGKKGILLSDGMGSGERAFQESKTAIELAEELLETGVSPELIVEMINAAMVTGAEEVEFATLDLCVLDLYQGLATFIKAGSATTYIKSKSKIRSYDAASLPLGVMATTEFDVYHTMLGDETYIVMMTDGVTELIPIDLRECYVETFLKCVKVKNPNEIAKELLEGLLRLQGEEIKDDMMVLVIGTWRY